MNEQKDSAGIAAAAAAVGIDLEEWLRRQRFVGFGQDDVKLLRDMADVVARHADAVVDRFYDNIEHFPDLVNLIRDSGSSMERLKATQRQYLLELFAGDYGASYLERRLRIGVVHHRIGLDPRFYLGSYSIYSQALLPLVRKRYPWNRQRQERAEQAITKLLSLDAQLAVDTYIHRLMLSLDEVSLSRDEVDRRVAGYRRFIANVATGDLTRRIEAVGDDELGSLGDQLNDMVYKLASMARSVNEAGSSMMVAVEQLQQSVSSQSAGAAQQASAVSETATTLEEIRVTSNQTRDKARSLGQAAERTREEGERGLQTVQGTIAAMQDIRTKVESIARNILALSEQTQQIGDITGLVSNMAQQLKILALNASIEASKVGEAGKGFAVVASEVRELAEQSQEATTQIRTILHDIQRATDRSVMATEEGIKGVDEGMRLVDQAGTAMRDLTQVIRETSLAGQQIVAAVGQEASGIDQIAAAMKDINGATKQFLAATQQTKQTALSLGDIAGALRASAAVYKV